ncbi:MAG TPA: acyl-homoserine-lactone synthase [Stellaceae bacterium]|nr:acyl-homoserine-lactone synthase [Stellaceae bacterium]
MMYMIQSNRFGEFAHELAEMHRLRYRVFKERLDWEVTVSGDMEIDEYDSLKPVYLLYSRGAGRIEGCVRLLPTTGPTMLRHSFPALLGPKPAPESPEIWESSRFSLDIDPDRQKAQGGLSPATFELFAGMVEFGLARGLREIVTVTDARMERILRRAGWPLRRLHDARRIGSTLAVAGFLEVSQEALARLRAPGGLHGPVLWEPVRLKESA